MEKDGVKGPKAHALVSLSGFLYKTFFHFRGSKAAESKYQDLGWCESVMIKKI